MSKKIKFRKSINASNFLLISLFIFLFFSLVSAQITVIEEKQKKIEDFNREACEFVLSTDDWRVISVAALFLSSIFIAALYIYGSVINSSFIARAKEELFQLFFTLIIFIFLAFIINTFMCSDIISSIFGLSGSPYTASYNYLMSVKDFVVSAAIKMGSIGATLSLISSFEYKSLEVSKSALFGALINPIAYFSDASLAIFTSLSSSYLVILVMINLLLFIPIISLKFFVPIGLIFRSIYPFRRFGGGLLGIGIALYVFFPLTLLLNNILVSNFISEPIKDLSLECKIPSDCYSHICEYDQNLGIKKCLPMKSDEEICNNDFECQSGFCVNEGAIKKCKPCVSEGLQGGGLPCCKGLILNKTTGKCEIGKIPGENCTNNDECVLSFCKKDSSGGVCVPLKKIGESCSSDEECISRNCVGIAPNKICKRSILTDIDLNSEFVRISEFSSTRPEEAQSMISELELSMYDIEAMPGDSYLNKAFDYLFRDIVITFIIGIVLPLINLTIIARATSDLSQALGQEIETASIWRLI